MSFDLYPVSIPVFGKALNNLRGLLQKGEAHARTHNLDQQELLRARLYPDMHPLAKQVQVASDTAKGGAARLAGLEVPRYADTETTFAELYARIDKTIAFVNTVRPEQLQGAAERRISVNIPYRVLEYSGSAYLLEFVLPNLYFHIAIAHGLLRHKGVQIGRADYIGVN